MPLTQNAPFDAGCAGLGAIFVTTPASTVISEPHNVPHSQQVLGTISACSCGVSWFIGTSCQALPLSS